jgi:hypothetical protein
MLLRKFYSNATKQVCAPEVIGLLAKLAEIEITHEKATL